jgi:REP element-mobilizing transposase RayT
MPTPPALYTAANCKVAYQLDWSVTVFWRCPPGGDGWLAPLQTATENDGVRIVRHRFAQPDCSLFLVSTKPEVAPQKMVALVKGRLQYLVRQRWPRAFQRNYALRSVGSTKRAVLDRYLQGQLGHHPMADAGVQAAFAAYQIHHPEVDLAQQRQTTHAPYWYNLHLVLVTESRWREVRPRILEGWRDMLERASRAKGHLLARAALLPDHLHLMLGCSPEEAPGAVALSYLNNLAFVCEMRPVFQFSYYVACFGEYDLGAIREGEENSPR